VWKGDWVGLGLGFRGLRVVGGLVCIRRSKKII
jgi:hypothetical protein